MRDKQTIAISRIVEPPEGILVFSEDSHPLFCNKVIRLICKRICPSGPCVLELAEDKAPELFNVIRAFRTDCEQLFRNQHANTPSVLIHHSIIYISRSGNFTIRCIQVMGERKKLRGPLWQINLFKGIALNSLDFDIVDRRYGLTAAELKVLRDLMGGLSNTEIAERLRVSKSTVKTHLRHIFKKLGISRRSQILSQLI